MKPLYLIRRQRLGADRSPRSSDPHVVVLLCCSTYEMHTRAPDDALVTEYDDSLIYLMLPTNEPC